MHQYLRSVGFADYTENDIESLYRKWLGHATSFKEYYGSNNVSYASFRVEVCPHIGIEFRGSLDSSGNFIKEYCFPYREADYILSGDNIKIEHQPDKEGYVGVLDDVRVGVDLVFFIQDIYNIIKNKKYTEKYVNMGGIALSALSNSGKVLLPIDKEIVHTDRLKQRNMKRTQLVKAARDGDNSAFKELTLTDMDIYTKITKRVEKNEDIYTIVSSNFMPTGLFYDVFQILGEIVDLKECRNRYTGQTIYDMLINCNQLFFYVTINKKDLTGEPEIGRRFKGDIWMQGKIDCRLPM